MGCGKSKLDVVTGNTRPVRKPLDAESVKGKENETIKRQESCRCNKTNDISPAVSLDRPQTTVENNTKRPEEKEAGGDCGERSVGETNDERKSEEKETTTSPSSVPENIVAEETINNVNESVLHGDEQKEKVDSERVAEEEKVIEDKTSGDVDTEIPLHEVEEPKPNVETPVTTESENDEVDLVETATSENVEPASTENEDTPVLKDEDENDLVETATLETAPTENEETPVLKDEDEVDLVENVETVEAASTENDDTSVLKDEYKVDLVENVGIEATENEEKVDLVEENPAKEVELA